jgi:hypothetical protein
MSNSVAGVMRESGSAWLRRCANRGVARLGAMQRRPWRLSTRSRPRAPAKEGARRRRGKKDQGPQAPHRGRHARQPVNRDRTLGGDSGPRGRPRRANAAVPPLQYDYQGLCRWQLYGNPDRLGPKMFGCYVEVVKRNELHSFKGERYLNGTVYADCGAGFCGLFCRAV